MLSQVNQKKNHNFTAASTDAQRLLKPTTSVGCCSSHVLSRLATISTHSLISFSHSQFLILFPLLVVAALWGQGQGKWGEGWVALSIQQGRAEIPTVCPAGFGRASQQLPSPHSLFPPQLLCSFHGLSLKATSREEKESLQCLAAFLCTRKSFSLGSCSLSQF